MFSFLVMAILILIIALIFAIIIAILKTVFHVVDAMVYVIFSSAYWLLFATLCCCTCLAI